MCLSFFDETGRERLITINFPLSSYRSSMRGYKEGKKQSIHIIIYVDSL